MKNGLNNVWFKNDLDVERRSVSRMHWGRYLTNLVFCLIAVNFVLMGIFFSAIFNSAMRVLVLGIVVVMKAMESREDQEIYRASGRYLTAMNFMA